MKKNYFLKTLMTIIITAIVTFSVTYLWLYGKTNNNGNGNEEIIGKALSSDALTTKLHLIKQKIESNFLGEIDEEKLKEYAIKGYVAGLGDEYSGYLTKEEMTEYTESTLGNYVGIGIYMTKDEEANTVIVYDVIEDSPAEKAGVKANDIIKNVDGKEITGDDFENVANMVKGKSGTTVNITFLRDNEEINMKIVRESVVVKSVKSEMLDDNVGYIYISGFDGDVSTQFKEQYDELVKKGMKSLVLDIRNNGGGIATEATEIAEYFTEKDTPLLIEADKNGNEETTIAESGKEINMNVVLLVNKYSASASEILAGVFKDKVDNATVVGTTTYGKGVIQALYQLNDGSGLKITTNKYYTPNHTNIHKEGIKPDIETEEYEFNGELDKEKDIQLKKALEVLKKQ